MQAAKVPWGDCEFSAAGYKLGATEIKREREDMGGQSVKRRTTKRKCEGEKLRRRILDCFGVDVGDARVLHCDAICPPTEIPTDGPWCEWMLGPSIDLTLKLQVDAKK